MIDQAFILAAGLGSRMQPLTADKPKPMVMVKGRPIIDYAIESLQALGIKNIAANTHYKAEVINPHLEACGVRVLHEPDLLDTGGGIKNALQIFDRDKPLLVLPGDSILVGNQAIEDLCAKWDGASMDLLLSLQPLYTMILTPGIGDYDLTGGKPVRSKTRTGAYMFNSARILHPRIFDHTPDVFSFLTLMDKMQQENRLAACVHNGVWHHLTTPDDVARVNRA